MGHEKDEKLQFMQSIRKKLEEEYQKEIAFWKPKEINAFLENLKSKIIEQCEKQQIKSSVNNIYQIDVKVVNNTNSFQPTSKTYIYSFSSHFDVKMFRRHFKESKTGFRDYTCNRYATYFGYPTWKSFLYRDEPKKSFEEFVDWETLLSSIYLKQPRFTTIPIIGSEILELNKLSMGEYFGEISYTPLNVLHQKEMLLYKEKHQRKNHKNYVESLRNDEFLSQKNLQDFNRILILGNPGTGKTIYSRWLCHQWARGKITSGVLPVHIELKGVDFDLDQPLFHYVKIMLEKQIGAFAFSKENISRFFFILDGFDEISPKQQTTLLNLLGTQQQVKFMLLSRPYAILGHEDKLEVDVIFELLGFGTNSQKLYTEKVLVGNGYKFNTQDFWELTSKHPFLSEFLSTPLTLSYLLILFIEQKKYDNDISLAAINSTYVLQQQVLYSLRRHFEKKATEKELYLQHLQSFDDAIINGGKLAYSMEKKLVFVVTYNDWDVSGGYTTILNLNEVGFGRLEFITKEKKKNLHREKGGRFSFITATIQEYLAASYFVKKIDTHNDNKRIDFLAFFSRNVSWNFCKMIIGKCVEDKEYAFLYNIKNVLSLNKKEKPNVNNLYRYLLFFSELDIDFFKKELDFEELKASFVESIKVIVERPTWGSLIIVVWKKIFLKIPHHLKREFNAFYCEYSQELLNDLLSQDSLNGEVLIGIETLIDLGSVPLINQDKHVVNKIIDWILQLNDVVIAMDLRIYGDDNLGEKLGFFVYNLEKLVDAYIYLIEEGGMKAILSVYEKVKQVLSIKWKPLDSSVQSLLEIIVLRSENLTVQTLLERLNKGLKENVSLNDIRFLLEALEWKLRIISLEYTDFKAIDKNVLVGILRNIVEKYHVTSINSESEMGIKNNTIQAILTLINYVASEEGYSLLFDIIEDAFTFEDHFQMKGIKYDDALDLYIKNLIKDYQEEDKNALETLVFQIVDVEEEDVLSLDKITYIETLELYLRAKLKDDNEEKKSQIFPFEIAEKQLIVLLSLVRVLYYLEPGTVLFSKNRDFFIASFEEVVLRNWCVLSEYIYWIGKDEAESLADICYQYLWYFRQLVFRDDFYDRKFLINKLLNGNIKKHPLIRQDLILCLFYNEMPICEDKYWNFLLSIESGNRDLEAIMNILGNNGIYMFKENAKYLQQIWAWFEEYSFEGISILDDGSGIYNPYNIFVPITNSLKYIIQQKLEEDVYAIQMIETISMLLKKSNFQNSIIFLFSTKKDVQNQISAVIAYLLILRFVNFDLNLLLKKQINKGNYDQKTVFSFLISLLENRKDYHYLEESLGISFYQKLCAFYDYYEDININPKLIPFE